jgi:hypothetical protein
MDDLDGKVYPVGTAGLVGLNYSFTRPAEDTTTDYTDAAIALRIFELNGEPKIIDGAISDKTRQLPPLSPTPALVLTVGSGLERTTNTDDTQAGKISLTPGNLETLLGTNTLRAFSYFWVITPTGFQVATKPLGDGYDGVFALAVEGYTLAALGKV